MAAPRSLRAASECASGHRARFLCAVGPAIYAKFVSSLRFVAGGRICLCRIHVYGTITPDQHRGCQYVRLLTAMSSRMAGCVGHSPRLLRSGSIQVHQSARSDAA
jgi:hypothetical protein